MLAHPTLEMMFFFTTHLERPHEKHSYLREAMGVGREDYSSPRDEGGFGKAFLLLSGTVQQAI